MNDLLVRIRLKSMNQDRANGDKDRISLIVIIHVCFSK